MFRQRRVSEGIQEGAKPYLSACPERPPQRTVEGPGTRGVPQILFPLIGRGSGLARVKGAAAPYRGLGVSPRFLFPL